MKSDKTIRRRKLSDLTVTKLRSAISNGSSLLADVDHRSATMRRLRDLITDHIADLGGADNLSSAELALVRRASMMILQAELLEARWQATDGEASTRDLDSYQRLVGALRRTLESLGLSRRAKVISAPAFDADAAIKRIRSGGGSRYAAG